MILDTVTSLLSKKGPALQQREQTYKTFPEIIFKFFVSFFFLLLLNQQRATQPACDCCSRDVPNENKQY